MEYRKFLLPVVLPAALVAGIMGYLSFVRDSDKYVTTQPVPEPAVRQYEQPRKSMPAKPREKLRPLPVAFAGVRSIGAGEYDHGSVAGCISACGEYRSPKGPVNAREYVGGIFASGRMPEFFGKASHFGRAFDVSYVHSGRDKTSLILIDIDAPAGDALAKQGAVDSINGLPDYGKPVSINYYNLRSSDYPHPHDIFLDILKKAADASGETPEKKPDLDIVQAYRADMDNDGKEETIAFVRKGQNVEAYVVHDGAYGPRATFYGKMANTGNPMGVKAIDLTGDGSAELVFAARLSNGGTYTVIMSDEFASPHGMPGVYAEGDIRDLDGDGLPEFHERRYNREWNGRGLVPDPVIRESLASAESLMVSAAAAPEEKARSSIASQAEAAYPEDVLDVAMKNMLSEAEFRDALAMNPQYNALASGDYKTLIALSVIQSAAREYQVVQEERKDREDIIAHGGNPDMHTKSRGWDNPYREKTLVENPGYRPPKQQEQLEPFGQRAERDFQRAQQEAAKAAGSMKKSAENLYNNMQTTVPQSGKKR